MDAPELRARAHQFAIDVTRFCATLPTDSRSQEIASQLHRAANSEDKNYRAACRGRNHDEFVAKICIVTEEADEAEAWLQTLIDTRVATSPEAYRLLKESTELLKIFAASKRTALRNQAKRREQQRRTRNRG
jgi:four helix bundle protein